MDWCGCAGWNSSNSSVLISLVVSSFNSTSPAEARGIGTQQTDSSSFNRLKQGQNTRSCLVIKACKHIFEFLYLFEPPRGSITNTTKAIQVIIINLHTHICSAIGCLSRQSHFTTKTIHSSQLCLLLLPHGRILADGVSLSVRNHKRVVRAR